VTFNSLAANMAHIPVKMATRSWQILWWLVSLLWDFFSHTPNIYSFDGCITIM